MSIAAQVKEALDNAISNGYPHDIGRPSHAVVAEIDDWSGIEGYNHYNRKNRLEACTAVQEWRQSFLNNTR